MFKTSVVRCQRSGIAVHRSMNWYVCLFAAKGRREEGEEGARWQVHVSED